MVCLLECDAAVFFGFERPMQSQIIMMDFGRIVPCVQVYEKLQAEGKFEEKLLEMYRQAQSTPSS